MPAVIYSPLIRKPRRISNDLFHITDWLPTLLSAAGISLTKATKDKLDGIDQWSSLTYGVPGNRKEVLLNINPVAGWTGLIKGEYKYVNKSQQPALDGWLSYANAERGYANDLNYADSVARSEAAVAIGYRFRVSDITKSLKDNHINCGTPPNKDTNPFHCDLSNQQCLFNIRLDPCEFYDVSNKYPDELRKMQDATKQYEKRMVPSLYQPTDPNCNPLYYNDTWVSWNDFPRSVLLQMTKGTT